MRNFIQYLLLQAVAKGRERLEQHRRNKLHKTQQISRGVLLVLQRGRVSKMVKKRQGSDTRMLPWSLGFSGIQDVRASPAAWGSCWDTSLIFSSSFHHCWETECLAGLAAGLTLQSISRAFLQCLLFLCFSHPPLQASCVPWPWDSSWPGA